MTSKSGIKDSRVLTYLNQRNRKPYVNTVEENELLMLWRTKYIIAKEEYNNSRANGTKVNVWRNAFEGKFYKLDKNGEQTDIKMKPIRKMAFEIVEGKVNSHIPAPKMSPRYHADLTPINSTEALIRHEIDSMLSEEVNDEAEHSVLIDGTTWFKVSWNPFDNTHQRSGNPVVECCPIDTVFPQPGVKNYKRLEYIFEEVNITLAEAIDIYDREITSPNNNDLVPIVNCYFLNEDRKVGKFTWCDETGIVLANDLEWAIRRRRECVDCHEPLPISDKCPVCGSEKFHYVSVEKQRLKEPLSFVVNPYRTGDTQDESEDENQEDMNQSIAQGTEIPYYLIRQLPFVPYRRIKVPNSIYGISEVEILLEPQDLANKFWNKAERKSAKSKAVVTKLKDTYIDDKDDELMYVEVENPEEGASIQVKQISADISEEMTLGQILYENVRSTAGVTDTDQGKPDTTARSGKAKQLQLAASAQRSDAPNTLRNAAYAGVYELIFKNLLAFSDEDRSFVSLLPDGTQKEEVWSKYMFLAQDDNGEFYYRDDFAWSVDTATEITQDRASMWQLIDNDYINGVMGNQIDPTRALLMYWNLKNQFGYPTAKYAVSFLKETVKHLPTAIEQMLVNNPEAVQLAMSFIQDSQKESGLGGTQGGARNNSGRQGNGASHAANVEKTNNANRSKTGTANQNVSSLITGGMQGGTQ